MQFKIEQVALAINTNREADAFALLKTLGIESWVHDQVTARGEVFGGHVPVSVGNLSFNYTALDAAHELEVLRYARGDNWLQQDAKPRVSHFGMHCTEEELAEWTRVLTGPEHNLEIVQELFTYDHTNPAIRGKRNYHYRIFGARHLIGVDLKFIVRNLLEEQQ